MYSNPSDPVIDEIRAVRHQISAAHDHDLAKLVDYLMQFQMQYRDRLTYDPTETSAVEPEAQLDRVVP